MESSICTTVCANHLKFAFFFFFLLLATALGLSSGWPKAIFMSSMTTSLEDFFWVTC